jgi:tetratricopeptide (TPR) repeat protein
LALYFQDKYDEAIKAWNETTRIDPSYTKAWSNKGNAFKLLGKTTESKAAYAKAKELGYGG